MYISLDTIYLYRPSSKILTYCTLRQLKHKQRSGNPITALYEYTNMNTSLIVQEHNRELGQIMRSHKNCQKNF